MIQCNLALKLEKFEDNYNYPHLVEDCERQPDNIIPFPISKTKDAINQLTDEVIGSLSDKNHGTAQNGLDTVADGKTGRCGNFDGTDDYIDCGTNLGLSGDFEGTIEAWFKADELKYQAIIVAGKAKTLQSFALFLFPDGEVCCAFNGGSNYISAVNTYTAGQWYHLVATKTPGLVSTQTKLYLNGVEISGSGPASTPNFVADVCYIGQWTNGDYHFNGKIDEVGIYDRALSAEEIQDLYTEPGAPPLQGCAAYWRMDEESWDGTVDEVTDSLEQGITTYTYDYENRMTKIVYADSSASEYTYDGAGKRIKTVEKDSQGAVTSTTKFLYDGLNVIIERDENDNTLAFYNRGLSYGGGIGGIISKKTSAGTNYYHYDGIGTVTGLTDTACEVIQTYQYDAYGNLLSSTGSEINNHLFSAKEHSANSGLSYFGARYYDPRVGRFISKDPLGMIDGPNMYLYVNNNPVNLIDPWGLCKKSHGASGSWDSEVPNPTGLVKLIPFIGIGWTSGVMSMPATTTGLAITAAGTTLVYGGGAGVVLTAANLVYTTGIYYDVMKVGAEARAKIPPKYLNNNSLAAQRMQNMLRSMEAQDILSGGQAIGQGIAEFLYRNLPSPSGL